jgi:peptidoglycan/LPS O-acetylase OafA/YrhL
LDFPDPVIIAALGGLILTLACLAASGSTFASQSILVYLGEISYSTYMICIPWKIVSVNAATKILGIEGEQLPLLIWMGIVAALIPLSAASYHLIEKPAREHMKAWAQRRAQRRLVAASA